LSEAELPAVTPLEFVVTHGEGGPGLDVREGELEQVYSVDDMYSRLLFVALCLPIPVHPNTQSGVTRSQFRSTRSRSERSDEEVRVD
jgi:hypothetical protein